VHFGIFPDRSHSPQVLLVESRGDNPPERAERGRDADVEDQPPGHDGAGVFRLERVSSQASNSPCTPSLTKYASTKSNSAGSVSAANPEHPECADNSNRISRLTQDQRQDRVIPPHRRRRLGLQEAQHQRVRPPRCLPGMAPRIHSPPAHTAIGRSAPITRLTNVPGQYI
jgi:hypothetical protein